MIYDLFFQVTLNAIRLEKCWLTDWFELGLIVEHLPHNCVLCLQKNIKQTNS